MSLNLKHRLEAPGLQRKAEAGEPFWLYCLLLPTPYVVATGPGQAGTEPRSRTFLAILLQSQGLETDSRILLSSSQLDSWQGNCVRACSTFMLTFCVVEAGREKLHFPDFFAVEVWVLTQVSTKGIPPKDLELGPELRERSGWDRLGQPLAGMEGGSQQLVGPGQLSWSEDHDHCSCWELFLEIQQRPSSSSPFSHLASHQEADCKFLSDEAD